MAKRRTNKRVQRRGKTRKQRGGVKVIDLGDGLKLNIIPFYNEEKKDIKQLKTFFTTHCWKNSENENEKFFHNGMYNNYNERDIPEGHYIYVTDAENNIIFAQLAEIKDNRPNDDEVLVEFKGSCTHSAHRGKGLFKKVLDAMIQYYRARTHARLGNQFNIITLTANYKNRNGITPQIRHKTFAKSGFELNNYINVLHDNYVKTEDGNIYKVISKWALTNNMKPNSSMEVVVEDAEGRKKIPVETIVGCYKKDANDPPIQVECPFSLLLWNAR